MGLNLKPCSRKGNGNMKKTNKLVLSGVFAAIICVTTMFPHFPIGIQGGYIHIGDTFIYLAASILPAVYAVPAAAIGSAMADLILGAPVYMPATFIIKALMALCFTNRGEHMLSRRNITAIFAAGAICVAGYYLAEVIMSGSFVSPIAAALLNIIQPTASGLLYVLAAKLLAGKLKGKF